MGRRAELRDTLRDDQQYCDWVKTVEPKNKSFKMFPEFLAASGGEDQGKHEETIGEKKRIRLNELSREAAAPSAEREMNITTVDAIARHLAAARREAPTKDEATAKRETAARDETTAKL